MRDILFHGKRIDDGEWLYGSLISLDKRIAEIFYMTGSSKKGIATVCIYVNPETVGQFTGLCDKNGTRIFEGDIVKINHPDDLTGDFTNAMGCVFYDINEGCFYHRNNNERPPKRMWEHVEVIGNIHDNPELLEAAHG